MFELGAQSRAQHNTKKYYTPRSIYIYVSYDTSRTHTTRVLSNSMHTTRVARVRSIIIILE